ncbi:MAG: hypothetical protein B7Z74_00590 [Deltaproteobacteria bacterium 21-66-5]|nr:MAG: hypothetical protein B7Z74_00590 [Deltaproteobacteria bacterium 21-66-5]
MSPFPSHLLSMDDLDADTVAEVLRVTDSFAEVGRRANPKVPALRGRTVATLFFGGWQFPYLGDAGFLFPGGSAVAVPPALVLLLRIGAFVSKVVFFAWLYVWIRWTIPRFRYDQVMRLGWKVMLPLSLLNIFATGLTLLLLKK